ncbi:phosphoribosyltransferase [Psychroflexus sediminis]|uniref:Phosphoribosyltransferase domain-containing protein n=1 Tax=Psychroflexus sediminis TaxID=470826 RepID=A0A1G7XED2_9FLAO|nr:phosphoribosyltransferase [Psychroflexus sediminis]SDG82473.1 hypothetical protein SAMN04488027_10853 [Psychroflexus sediminis]
MTSNDKDFKAEIVSLQKAYEDSLKLAEKIAASSDRFDAIVGIARGGFPPARFLCDFLNIEELHSIQVKHYGSGAEEKEDAEVLNKDFKELSDKNVLLVDDVNDSGKTLKAASKFLEAAALLKTAVIHEKDTTNFKADFVGEPVKEWRWLIYQWAAAEDVLGFLKEGDMLEADATEAQQFLEDTYSLEVEMSLLTKILATKSAYK